MRPADQETRIKEVRESEKEPMRNTSIVLSQGDLDLLKEIQDRLQVKRSEAMRTSIRVYHAMLIGNK